MRDLMKDCKLFKSCNFYRANQLYQKIQAVIIIKIIFIKKLQISLKNIIGIAKSFKFTYRLIKENVQNEVQNIFLIIYSGNI